MILGLSHERQNKKNQEMVHFSPSIQPITAIVGFLNDFLVDPKKGDGLERKKNTWAQQGFCTEMIPSKSKISLCL